jgi:hypothetical protein
MTFPTTTDPRLTIRRDDVGRCRQHFYPGARVRFHFHRRLLYGVVVHAGWRGLYVTIRADDGRVLTVACDATHLDKTA